MANVIFKHIALALFIAAIMISIIIMAEDSQTKFVVIMAIIIISLLFIHANYEDIIKEFVRMRNFKKNPLKQLNIEIDNERKKLKWIMDMTKPDFYTKNYYFFNIVSYDPDGYKILLQSFCEKNPFIASPDEYLYIYNFYLGNIGIEYNANSFIERMKNDDDWNFFIPVTKSELEMETTFTYDSLENVIIKNNLQNKSSCVLLFNDFVVNTYKTENKEEKKEEKEEETKDSQSNNYLLAQANTAIGLLESKVRKYY